jgi:hypothetical protein
MTTFLPVPVPNKGVTAVRGLRLLRFDELSPPWGGPSEATK